MLSGGATEACLHLNLLPWVNHTQFLSLLGFCLFVSFKAKSKFPETREYEVFFFLGGELKFMRVVQETHSVFPPMESWCLMCDSKCKWSYIFTWTSHQYICVKLMLVDFVVVKVEMYYWEVIIVKLFNYQFPQHSRVDILADIMKEKIYINRIE